MSQAFFDGFDGNKLGSNWKISNFGHQGQLHYVVANSLLKVNGLDGDPTGFSAVEVRTAVDSHYDFQFTTVFGWDPGTEQRMTIGVGDLNDDFGATMLAGISFAQTPTGATLKAYADGMGSFPIPLPPGGMHEFRFVRVAGTIWAYFDGSLVAHGPMTRLYDVGAAGMYFAGPNDGVGFAPLYVDSIEVVAEPASLITAITGVGAAMLRRRNRR